MIIRKSKLSDVDRMLEIYEYARAFMKETGNPNQWKSYPKRELLEADIAKGTSHVIVLKENPEVICGTFVLAIGEDPTYGYIEGDGWLNDELYGTIHRVAGDGSQSGLLKKVIEYGFNKVDNIRIDTHYDNKVMQHLVEKEGFTKCGTIYVSDDVSNHSPRVAYQKAK